LLITVYVFMYSHFVGEKILLCQWKWWFSGGLSAIRTNTRHCSCLLILSQY